MAIEHTLDSALAEAVRATDSQSAFARLIGRRQSTVYHWLKHGVPLPAEYVRDVARETGVPMGRLRPDLFHGDRTSPDAATMEPHR